MSRDTKFLILKYIIIFLISAFIVVVNLLAKNDFTSIVVYCDGFFIAGFSMLCVSALSVVNYFGAFEIFVYMFHNVKNGSRQTLSQYSENRRIVKSKTKLYFIPYLIIGGIFIFVALILSTFL